MRIPSKLLDLAKRTKEHSRTLAKAASAAIVRTNVRRWREVAKNPNPHWDGRNQLIAGFIPAGLSVIDLGCGPQTLRRHLDPSCKYQPCDVVQSTPDVIFCDFNAGIYPEIKGDWDYVVCSGIFEYMRKPKEFLEKNSQLAKAMILTYNPLYQYPGDSKVRRLNCDWTNHLTKPEVEALFDEVGLEWKILNVAHDQETTYLLHNHKKLNGARR